MARSCEVETLPVDSPSACTTAVERSQRGASEDDGNCEDGDIHLLCLANIQSMGFHPVARVDIRHSSNVTHGRDNLERSENVAIKRFDRVQSRIEPGAKMPEATLRPSFERRWHAYPDDIATRCQDRDA